LLQNSTHHLLAGELRICRSEVFDTLSFLLQLLDLPIPKTLCFKARALNLLAVHPRRSASFLELLELLEPPVGLLPSLFLSVLGLFIFVLRLLVCPCPIPLTSLVGRPIEWRGVRVDDLLLLGRRKSRSHEVIDYLVRRSWWGYKLRLGRSSIVGNIQREVGFRTCMFL
jgi:hypothetical protein